MKKVIKGKLYNSETAESVALRLIGDAEAPPDAKSSIGRKAVSSSFLSIGTVGTSSASSR